MPRSVNSTKRQRGAVVPLWENRRVATVDIIIPAYNAARYLAFALESVLAQDFEDWQAVLVDDGSTDTTPQIAAEFAPRFGSKLTYVRQENRGLPAARNTAIRSSNSEFLALLDSDDVWLPWRLSESVQALRSHPAAGLSYGGITLIDAEGKPGQSYTGDEKNASTRVSGAIYTREIHLPCPTVTFRRSCVEEVGFFDESMRATEDRDLWFRIALKHEVTFIPKVISYYRVSPQSMSTDPDRMLIAQLQFIRKHYGETGCDLRMRQIALARAYKARAEALSARKRRWAAVGNSLRAVAMYPLDRDNIRTATSMLLACAGLGAFRNTSA